MISKIPLILLGLLSCFFVDVLQAQTRQDVQQILTEAVRSARDDLFARQPYLSKIAGELVVDPFSQRLRGGTLPQMHRDDQMRNAISAVVDGRSGSVEETYNCPEPMRRCNLRGAVALIALGAPIVEGDTARVQVKWYFVAPFRGELPSAAGAKRVADMVGTYILGRESGRWQVVGQEHGPVS